MSVYFKSFLYIFIIAFGVFSCSLIPNELETAEKLIETNPDSALHILQAIRPEQYTSGENRALYGLLMVKTMDKKLMPLTSDSLLDFPIEYYSHNPYNDRLADCYLYKARFYKDHFQYETAMGYYMKALDESQNSKNALLKGRINFDLGYIYIIQRDFSRAREKFLLAYPCLKGNNESLAFYSLLNIGRTYHEAKDYINAQAVYRNIFHESKDSVLEGALLQEIALNYYDSHNLDSSRLYLQKVINYPYIGNNRAIRYLMLADLYFDIENFDSAKFCALKSIENDSDIRIKKNHIEFL